MTAQIDTTQIAETAYHIWMEEGQPEGRDEANWFAAIERLTPAPAPKKKAPARKKPAAKAAAAKKAPAKPRAKKAAAAK